MTFPKRKSLRLPGYDYSQNGAYFVTICTQGKQCILGHIVGAGRCARPQIRLSDIGTKVQDSIEYLPHKYDCVHLDAWVIMPNHIHLLLRLEQAAGGLGGPPLQEIIGRFKSYTTHLYSDILWQRSFYEHVIRGQQDYLEIWEYIENNPLKWELDKFYRQ